MVTKYKYFYLWPSSHDSVSPQSINRQYKVLNVVASKFQCEFCIFEMLVFLECYRTVIHCSNCLISWRKASMNHDMTDFDFVTLLRLDLCCCMTCLFEYRICMRWAIYIHPTVIITTAQCKWSIPRIWLLQCLQSITLLTRFIEDLDNLDGCRILYAGKKCN